MDSNLILWIALVLPILYVSPFLHELGHALLGRCNGYLVTSFGLGLGRPYLCAGWRDTRVYFSLSRPLHGVTFWFSKRIFPTTTQKLWALGGGILVQSLVAAAALVLLKSLSWGEKIWITILLINALGAFGNLVPFSFTVGRLTFHSDGALILRALLRKREEPLSPQVLQNIYTLLPIFQAIGDHVGRYIYLLSAALLWSELGDAEYAEHFCAEAETVPLKHTVFTRAYGTLLRGMVARAAQKSDACRALLNEAEGLFQEMQHDVGLCLIRLARAELLLQEGNDAVLTEVDELAGSSVCMQEPALRAAVLVLRILARTTTSDMPIDNLIKEYRTARCFYPSLINDLHLHKALGRYYVQRQDWHRAGHAYIEAMEAAQELACGFADEADRQRFLRCHVNLFAEIPDLFTMHGEHEIAERLRALHKLPAKLEDAKVRRRVRMNRIWLVTGQLLTLLNAAVGTGALLFELSSRKIRLEHPGTGYESVDREIQILALCGSLLFFVAVTWLYTLVSVLTGFFIPAWQRANAMVTIMLGVSPWVCWLFLLIWLALSKS